MAKVWTENDSHVSLSKCKTSMDKPDGRIKLTNWRSLSTFKNHNDLFQPQIDALILWHSDFTVERNFMTKLTKNAFQIQNYERQ